MIDTVDSAAAPKPLYETHDERQFRIEDEKKRKTDYDQRDARQQCELHASPVSNIASGRLGEEFREVVDRDEQADHERTDADLFGI